MYRKFLHMLLVMAITMSMLLLSVAPASALDLGNGLLGLSGDDGDDGDDDHRRRHRDRDDDDDGNNCLLGILCLFGDD